MQSHNTHLLSLSSPPSSSITSPLLLPRHNTASCPKAPHPRRRLSVSAAAAPTADVARWRTAADMYGTLEVAETAGREEIKAAYRRQARRWHPDVCRRPGERVHFSERFMEAREAYRVLSDPALREHYDLCLRTGTGFRGGEPPADVTSGTRRRGLDRWGFGGWQLQLDGLSRRRRHGTVSPPSQSWGSRMRAMNGSDARPDR